MESKITVFDWGQRIEATIGSRCREVGIIKEKSRVQEICIPLVIVVFTSLPGRNLFYNKERTDAEQLARLVEYVRKNVQHLDNISSEQILCNGNITWLPFREEETVESDAGEDS